MGAVLGVLEGAVALLAVAAATAALYLAWRQRQGRVKWAALAAYPHAPGHWLLGNIVNYGAKKALVEFEETMHVQLNSDIFVMWIGMPWVGTPMVMIRDAVVGRDVMVTQNVPKAIYHGLLPVMGISLLTANGDAWRKRRRMVNPGFSDSFLRNIEPAMDDRVRTWVNLLRQQVLAGTEVIDPHTQLALVTLDVIGLIGFEHDFHFSDGKAPPERPGEMSMQAAVNSLLAGASEDAWNPFRWLTKRQEYLRYLKALAMFKDVSGKLVDVAMERARQEQPLARPTSILAMMAAQGVENPEEALTKTDMMNEIVTFLFAGHETTAGTLSFALLLLSANPEVKRRLMEEIDEVFGDKDHVSHEDLGRFKYMTLVLKEVLRLFPIGYGTVRQPPEDMVLGGHAFPKGSRLFINFFCTQRNPAYWPDSNKFISERHESSEGHLAGSYTPFAAGPRICIGQSFAYLESKMVLAHFLRTFDWEVVNPEVMSPVDFIATITLRPVPYQIRLKVRSYT